MCATVVAFVAVLVQATAWPVLALTADEYQNKLNQQEELRRKIEEAQGQERTLANEIARMDNQIALNELELADTQGQIQSTQNLLLQVNSDIGGLTAKLDRLDGTIVRLEEVAEQRVRASYKQSRLPAISAVVTADSFRDAMLQYAYVREMQEQDAKLLDDINQNRKDYREQKDNLARLRTEKEQLQRDLEAKQAQVLTQQKELSDAKAQRASLLEITQNNEATYQRLLAQVQAELLTVTAQRGVYLGHFAQGSPIAREGSTGCSTGSHLHFEVQRQVGNSWVPVNPHVYLDSGQMTWPEQGFYITQEYGVDPWGLYAALGQPGHTGIDMSSGYGSTIYAAAEGDAWTSGDNGCPGLIPGTGGAKGIIIYHPQLGNVRSLYWHIQ